MKTTGGGAVTSLGSTVRYKVDGTGLILTGYADDGGVSGTYDGTDRMIFTLTITAAGAYTFALNAQLDHVDLGDTGLLALNLSPALVATDFDGDQATLATGFTVNVENDVPIAVNDANEIPYEGGAKIGSTGGTLTKATLLLNDSPGADSTIRISAITYVNGVGVTVTGLPVPDGGSTGVLTTLLGSLQVWSNGNWEYTPAATLSHTTDPLSEDLTYTIIDKDGDMATAKKSFYVYDTSPTISAPTRIIADQGTLPVTVVGHLPAVLVADAFNVLFNVPAPPAGLASGGNIIAYSFPSTTQLVATIHSGADEVFRITLDNTTPTNATYTFVQSRVIDHVAGAPVLDLPFKYKVTETLAPATENTLLNGSTALFHVSVNGGTVLTPAPATDDTLLFTGAIPAALVDMGAGGFDTLLFTSGTSLANLNALNSKVSNLEVIDLSVDGVNSLGTVATPLLTADVNAIGSSNSLYVLGTSGDHVILGGSFVKQAASSTYSYNSGSHVMDVYKDAALSTVYVEQGVSVP